MKKEKKEEMKLKLIELRKEIEKMVDFIFLEIPAKLQDIKGRIDLNQRLISTIEQGKWTPMSMSTT